MKLAGLDIGTTGCKLTVFDEKGGCLDHAYRDYPASRVQSVHEMDAEAILDGVFSVMGEIGKRHPDIAGIGVTSFGESFVMTDEMGKPLHKVMLYTDPRGSAECRELEKKAGGRNIASITGLKPHEMYSLPKIMWMKRNRPEIYDQARHIFLMEDYVVFALTGNAQIDYSLASRTMAFDITALKWSREMLRLAEVDEKLLSKTVPTGTSAGCILPEIAHRTGIDGRAQIVSISHDQVAAAVGAGVFSADAAVDGAGTVECITPVYDSLPPLEVMYNGNYAVVPYVIPGKYVCYAFSYTGGALIQWCADTLAKKEKETAREKGISVNELLERIYAEGKENAEEPSGLLMLPHFAGAATPYMDTGSKGAILGLTLGTQVCDIYRACMESVVYEMLLNLKYLKESGLKTKILHATGGGAKSQVWMQMKADILQLPITALKTVDAGTVGSAMLTGVAVGCYPDLETAAGYMVEKKNTYYPRKEMYEKYRKIIWRYEKLYSAVRPLMDEAEE